MHCIICGLGIAWDGSEADIGADGHEGSGYARAVAPKAGWRHTEDRKDSDHQPRAYMPGDLAETVETIRDGLRYSARRNLQRLEASA